MVDAKVTLELLQNGVQKVIYAKANEHKARRILCTFTQNGKVFNVTGFGFKVFHKDGDTVEYYYGPNYIEQIPGTSTVAFTLPDSQSGEHLYEFCLTQDNTIIYAPQFKVFYEGTIGPGDTPASGTVPAYEPKLTLSDVETEYEDEDYIVVSSATEPNDTYRISFGDFIGSLTADDITYEGTDSVKDKLDDIDTDISDINTALDTKVDKVDGKGLSTKDYTEADQTKLSGIEAGAQVNTITSVNTKTGAVVLDGDDIAYDSSSSVNDKIDELIESGGAVQSVNGQTGVVVLDGDDIAYDNNNSVNDKIDAVNTIASGKVGSVNGKTGTVTLDGSEINTTASAASNTIGYDILTLQSGKVDKVNGKGLSTNDYTDAEKTKLSGIAAGAEVNVQSDWNQSDNTADDYIKNKPAETTLILEVDNGLCNYSKAELDTAVSEGKVITYGGAVLDYVSSGNNTIVFHEWDAQTCSKYLVNVGDSSSEYTFSRAAITNSTLANNVQTVDSVSDTIANHLTSLKSQIANKIDEPSTAGTQGQVLSLDSSLNPVWANASGGLMPVIQVTAPIGASVSVTDGTTTYTLTTEAETTNVNLNGFGTWTTSITANSRTYTKTYVVDTVKIYKVSFNALPDGFTELQYVTVTSGYYINTGVSVTGHTDVRVKFRQTGNTSYGPHIFSNSSFYLARPYTYKYNNNESVSATPTRESIGLNTWATTSTDYANHQETVNNIVYTLNIGSQNTGGTLYFLNYSSPSANYGLNGDVAYGEIIDNGVSVRHYIPCRKEDTNTVGFYDIAQNQFVTGSGGTITAGPEA